MDEQETRVHAHHCCKKHGCKYGDDDCPVAYGDVEQIYPCPDCDEDALYEEYKELGIIENDRDFYEDPDFDIEAPDIEWVMCERRKGYDREHKAFWQGFVCAFLIIILIHILLSYILL